MTHPRFAHVLGAFFVCFAAATQLACGGAGGGDLRALMASMPASEANAWLLALGHVNRAAASTPSPERAAEHAFDCAVVLRGPRGDGIPRADVLSWCEQVVANERDARVVRAQNVRAEALAAVERALAQGAPDDASLAQLEASWVTPCGDLVARSRALPTGHPARVACERALARARALRAESEADEEATARLNAVLRAGTPAWGSVAAMESYERDCTAWRARRAGAGVDGTDVGRFCAEVSPRLAQLRRELEGAREREITAVVATLSQRQSNAPCGVALYRGSDDPRIVAVRRGAIAPCGEHMRALVTRYGTARPWLSAFARRIASEAGALGGAREASSGLPLRLARDACAGNAPCLPCGAAGSDAYVVRAVCRTRQEFVEQRVVVPGAEIVRREAVPGTNLTREVRAGWERGGEVARRVPVTVTFATGEVSIEPVPGAVLQGPFVAGGSVSRDDDGLSPQRVLVELSMALSRAAATRRDEALRRSVDASLDADQRLDAAAEHLALGGTDEGARRALAPVFGLDVDESLWRRLASGP